jgi:ribosomal protein S18 acetylase RimI-like enzyme
MTAMLGRMTDTSAPVSIRRATPDDLPLLLAWTSDGPVAWIDAARLSAEWPTRAFRPEWSWIAEQDGRVIGRALWWGAADADRPFTLDCLTTSSSDHLPERIGGALIRAGLDAFGPGSALEFNVDVDPDWASDPEAVDAVRWRQEAARAGGFARSVERVRFVRSASDPLPMRSTRVRFVRARDEAFHELFARVATGTLDAHTLDIVAREGVEALADDDLAFYLSLPGERDAWRIAELPDGTTIGFIIPTRTAYDASISYLGVLPEHRGHGYVHDLLAEMVHVHHDDGQPRIVGTTDATNLPMRAAFERAGFGVTRVRIVHAQ